MSSLYIHIPFRAADCSYREEYYVIQEGPFTGFVDALIEELEHYAARYAGQEPLDTVYLGGGTPSLLSPEEVDRLLKKTRERFVLERPAEITMELNPADVSRRYLERIGASGVSRVSLSIESFFAQDLDRLGCRHSAEQARAALLLLPAAGFANYSVDLLFGVPDQPLEYWQANLERAVRHETPHIATYRADALPHETGSGENPDPANEQYRFAVEYLRDRGYEPYELSHFAHPGFASSHLQTYWSHGNYIGLGPSAHSFWWEPGGAAYRWNNTKNVVKYCHLLRQREMPLEARERLSQSTLTNEYIMLRLQTAEGVDLNVLNSRYGADLMAEKCERLDDLECRNWIEWIDEDRFRLTDEGKFRHEAITSHLLISQDHRTTP